MRLFSFETASGTRFRTVEFDHPTFHNGPPPCDLLPSNLCSLHRAVTSAISTPQRSRLHDYGSKRRYENRGHKRCHCKRCLLLLPRGLVPSNPADVGRTKRGQDQAFTCGRSLVDPAFRTAGGIYPRSTEIHTGNRTSNKNSL